MDHEAKRDMNRSEQVLLIALVGSQLLLTGCGGGTSQDDMRQYAIRRPTAPEETEVAAAEAADVSPTDSVPESVGTSRPQALATASVAPLKAAATSSADSNPTQNQDAVATEIDAIPPATPPAEPLSPAQRRERAANNMKAIGTAWRAYLDERGYFPGPVASVTKEPLLSWRVDLLPYLGLQSLYESFHLNEPWDSPHNIALLAKIPGVFQSPERFDTNTNYLALSLGGSTILQERRKIWPSNVEDGIENTLALVEVDEDRAVPWTKPTEFPLDPVKPLKSLGSLRENGMFVVWSNGTASWIDGAVDPKLFEKACTIDSGDGFRASQIANELSAGIAIPAQPSAETTGAQMITATPNAPVGESIPTGVAAPQRSLSDAHSALNAEHDANSRHSSAKEPIPSPSDLKAACDLLRELYQADYAAAKTASQRLQLASKMLNRLPDLGGDLAGQYALLEIVQQIAFQAGSVEVALDAADRMTSRFELKDDLLLDAIEKLARTAQDRRALDRLLEEAETLFDELVLEEQFAEAERLSQLAVTVASKVDDETAIDEFTSRRNWASEANALHKSVEDSLATLEQNPEDPRANGDVGKYLCLVKSDWENGLVILANGNDRSLKRLAEMELGDMTDAMRQLELADLWWREAETELPAFKTTLQLRAKHWYERSLSGLPAGLVRIRVERRIEELANPI
jgi:hypothetical protein